MDGEQVELTIGSYECKFCGTRARMILLGRSKAQKLEETVFFKDGYCDLWESCTTYKILECTNASCRKINVLGENLSGIGGYDNTVVYDYKGCYHLPDETLYRLSTSQGEPDISKLRIEIPKSMRFVEEFVKDNNFKQYIINDLKEINESFKNGLYKSTIILCGSVFECLMIYTLLQIKQEAIKIYEQNHAKYPHNWKMAKGTVPEISEWNLFQLREVAEPIGVLQADGLAASDNLKDYRNLIHYNQWMKTGLTAKETTATSMINKLEIVFEDVLKWYSSPSFPL